MLLTEADLLCELGEYRYYYITPNSVPLILIRSKNDTLWLHLKEENPLSGYYPDYVYLTLDLDLINSRYDSLVSYIQWVEAEKDDLIRKSCNH